MISLVEKCDEANTDQPPPRRVVTQVCLFVYSELSHSLPPFIVFISRPLSLS